MSRPPSSPPSGRGRTPLAPVPLVLGSLVLGGALVGGYVSSEASRLTERGERKERPELVARGHELAAARPRLVVALAPLLGAVFLCLLAAGALPALGPRRLGALLAGLCAFCWLVVALGPPLGTGLDAARAPPWRQWFPAADPYWVAIVTATSAAAAWSGGALRRPGLHGAALSLWLLLWIPFDLRWVKTLWQGPSELGYAAPALWIVLLILVAEGGAGRGRALGLRLFARRDLARLGGVVLLLAGLMLPLGFGLGFLSWNPQAIALGSLTLKTLGIALTVALPEELFFRSVLDVRLRESFAADPRPSAPELPPPLAAGPAGVATLTPELERGRWTSLLCSSLAFGIMHVNNRSDLREQLIYFALASLAGACYGLAFRRGGLLAAVALHTLVDVVWQVALR